MPDQALQPVRLILAAALQLLPGRMNTAQARVPLLAICGQEADFHHRWQVVDPDRPERMGPARGLWQFERGGGVRGVLTHPASRDLAARACRARGVDPTRDAVYEALSGDDVLAAALARLLLWTDPVPLPDPPASSTTFSLYLRTWRPGAYTRGSASERARLRRKWDSYYSRAVAADAEPLTLLADFSNVISGSSSTEEPR